MFRVKVKDIMTKKVITASKDDTFYKVAILMKENDIGFVPIMEDNNLIGVITDRDIVIRGIANKENHDSKIDKYITPKVVTIDKNASINEASKIMAEKQLKRLLVTDNDKLVGVLTLFDITINNENRALEALKGINKNHQNNLSDDNTDIDDFKL
ncbi:MAG: CBS domain-containing protein [Bacilli bacterium]|nr:CBS domain-containing protein [Bacilli bacterium]